MLYLPLRGIYRFSLTRILPHLDRMQAFFAIRLKYAKTWVRGNPYSGIFCAVHDFLRNMTCIAYLSELFTEIVIYTLRHVTINQAKQAYKKV